jgi:hypothetical protein
MMRWLACFLTLIACGGTEPKSTSLLFEGTVTDVATGAPIPGTSLGVGDGSGFGLPTNLPSTTDSEGHYTLSWSCVNNPYLYAYAPHYYFHSVKVECRAERQTSNVSLTRDPNAP